MSNTRHIVWAVFSTRNDQYGNYIFEEKETAQFHVDSLPEKMRSELDIIIREVEIIPYVKNKTQITKTSSTSKKVKART